MITVIFFFFFFSSRRRHTRFSRDWSSDVCSSDLRKVASRSPISAKLVADLLESAGATRVVSMDMHAGQIQGFFNIPFDHLYAAPVLLEHMKQVFGGAPEDLVVVSPDAG